jgi:hypothetical protein
LGTSGLAGPLDSEDLYDVICAYQDACAGIISRFDGPIAHIVGLG